MLPTQLGSAFKTGPHPDGYTHAEERKTKMAERKAERNDGEYCPKCQQRYSLNNATRLHSRKAYEALQEQLEEERKTSKRKLEEKEDEITVLKGKLKTEKVLCNEEIEKLRKKLEEYTRESELERVKGEADTVMLEENFRQGAATKKDIEEICANLLSSQYASLKQQKDEEMSTLLQKLKDELSENETRCPENAEKCKRLRSDWSKLQATLNSAEIKEKELNAKIEQYEEHIQMLTQQIHVAQMIEAQNAEKTQRIAELEEELSKRHIPQLNKRPSTYSQPEIHEDLLIEYEKLFTSFEVLKLVEHHFNDSFDSKGFLSDIFMDAYAKCKECLIDLVCKNIDELFKVQTCENRTDDMEGLSHAFGLLLQNSGIKMLVTRSEAISDVKTKVKENAPQLRRFKRAKVDPTNALEKLPLDKFVKLAWKFVAQAYPVIVSMPPMLTLNEEIHKSSFRHWDERKERPLIYAQPIVYRSYHGEVLIKGLVGNVY